MTSSDRNQESQENFIYTRYRYCGRVKPENLAFNANLQEFSQKVAYIVNLETNGKLLPGEAFNQIEELWEELKRSKDGLKIDNKD
ncbi:hypothetical protein [Nostoc sp. CCY 9925]|uniref:DUF7219 family protein n=1 Tax=Nostoc sp. CCY 9925 TaxID=3103865 RepID=UPI0039C66EDA